MAEEQKLANKVMAMIGRASEPCRVTDRGAIVITVGELDKERLVRKALSL